VDSLGIALVSSDRDRPGYCAADVLTVAFQLEIYFSRILGPCFFSLRGRFSAGASPSAIWFGISNASVPAEGTIRKQREFPSIFAAKTVHKHHFGGSQKEISDTSNQLRTKSALTRLRLILRLPNRPVREYPGVQSWG
jgi:hypothetical protein